MNLENPRRETFRQFEISSFCPQLKLSYSVIEVFDKIEVFVVEKRNVKCGDDLQLLNKTEWSWKTKSQIKCNQQWQSVSTSKEFWNWETADPKQGLSGLYRSQPRCNDPTMDGIWERPGKIRLFYSDFTWTFMFHQEYFCLVKRFRAGYCRYYGLFLYGKEEFKNSNGMTTSTSSLLNCQR